MSEHQRTFDKTPLTEAQQKEIRRKISKEIKLLSWFQLATGAGSLMPIIKSNILPFDMYLLRYRVGECAATHTDKTGRKTYRLNFVFNILSKGGKFYGKTILSFLNIHLFRADKEPHGVTTVQRGIRYVISFGLHI